MNAVTRTARLLHHGTTANEAARMIRDAAITIGVFASPTA